MDCPLFLLCIVINIVVIPNIISVPVANLLVFEKKTGEHRQLALCSKLEGVNPYASYLHPLSQARHAS